MRAAPGARGKPRSQPARGRSLDPECTITVVSGLPRSGTSLMMQMLEAAGLSIATDGVRAADPDNPRGYYELEAVKTLARDASFLDALVGRVVKIVSPLLPALPRHYDYRIVVMERDLDEVLGSQRAMLERIESPEVAVDEAGLARAFAAQLGQVERWLASSENAQSLVVSHRELLETPQATAATVVAFLEETGAVTLREAGALSVRMAGVVDRRLLRQRAAPSRIAGVGPDAAP